MARPRGSTMGLIPSPRSGSRRVRLLPRVLRETSHAAIKQAGEVRIVPGALTHVAFTCDGIWRTPPAHGSPEGLDHGPDSIAALRLPPRAPPPSCTSGDFARGDQTGRGGSNRAGRTHSRRLHLRRNLANATGPWLARGARPWA